MKRDNEDRIAAARRLKPTEWMGRANCCGGDAGLFYPERGDMDAIRQARQVCGGCTVNTQCLDYSNTFPIEDDGIWAGRTASERQKLRMGRAVRS